MQSSVDFRLLRVSVTKLIDNRFEENRCLMNLR